jgi:hypothetical protein
MTGKISIQDTGKYSSGGNNDFFQLADDGDVAVVRFLYDQEDGSDIDYYLVHEVEVDGKKRYVACLGLDNDGNLHPDNCPLCAAGYKRIEKLFLQVYVEADDAVKTWDRGKTFVSKITSYINRYGSLVSQAFEIERKGKKGDKKTSYEMFPMEKDSAVLEDFPEKQELLGTFILDLGAEEMDMILDGSFTLEDQHNEPQIQPQRRPSSSSRPSRGNESSNRRSQPKSEEKSEEKSSRPTRGGHRTRNTGKDAF